MVKEQQHVNIRVVLALHGLYTGYFEICKPNAMGCLSAEAAARWYAPNHPASQPNKSHDMASMPPEEG